MKLYDESIHGFYETLKDWTGMKLRVSDDASKWPDIGEKNMILRSDMAYELGGGSLYALSSLSLTSNEDFVPEDEVLLYGPNISEIKEDTSYARIAVVRVKEDVLGEGNALYNAIRKIEYVRYHINPKGYMMRISATNEREPVRVAKDAINEGLDFAKIGRLFLEEYHKNPKIEAVKLIFITDPKFPYKQLQQKISKNEQITAAIDHMMKNVTMDCNACNLKPVCDEVEGMRELHFGTANPDEKIQ